jgi:chromosome segregation ATPase
VTRIKAIIAGMPRQEKLPALPSDLPQTLVRKLQHVTSEASQQIRRSSPDTGQARLGSAGPAREENARLRKQVEDLENEVLTSAERLGRAESQHDETGRALKQLGQEKADLAQSLGSLQSALRNAESDFALHNG